MACTATTPAPTTILPTRTARATSTPTLIPPTATPVQLTLRVTDELVNCRYGPATTYALVNELKEEQAARVIGRNHSSTWWYIRDPGNPNGMCWVSADVTEIQGKAERLPVVSPPPITITKASLRIEPARIIVACDQFPQTVFFEAEITANGPTFAIWRWEASTGVKSDDRILVFEEAGMKVINGYYQIAAPNDYWIRLHIFKPNDMSAQVNFPVNCTP